jgi:bifunctional UDP-N-acetylglucosamine pyrophosphorylase/glucosamine-1-phosphate N-acetyltransferase
MNTNKIDYIILAGGKGTRMQIDLPKALVNLKGKPLLQHVLDTFRKVSSVVKPVIVVGHMADLVKEKIGSQYRYALQTEQLGTGHAVAITKNHINNDTDTIFVSYTDQPFLKPNTIRKIVDLQSLDKNSVITMATSDVGHFNDWHKGFERFGRIKRDDNGQVVAIIEYKDADDAEKKITEINPAYFAFKTSWLWSNIDKLKNHNNQKEYYLTDLVALAIRDGFKINTYNIEPIEAIGANSKEELAILEYLMLKYQKG